MMMDGWMVRRAVYFLQGQWMGPYDQYMLIKGVFSPLLLAFSIGIGATPWSLQSGSPRLDIERKYFLSRKTYDAE